MPLETGLWRAGADVPVRAGAPGFPLESRLEELIQSDPTILGEPLLVIGRQVPTAHGKFVDLLAVAADDTLHVLELKRDRTLRDVVAQVPDHGSRAGARPTLMCSASSPASTTWHTRLRSPVASGPARRRSSTGRAS
jgi:hypothetical protein